MDAAHARLLRQEFGVHIDDFRRREGLYADAARIACTLVSIIGGSGNTQPRLRMISCANAGGIATIISGSMENRPSNPPMALRACTPANPPGSTPETAK